METDDERREQFKQQKQSETMNIEGKDPVCSLADRDKQRWVIDITSYRFSSLVRHKRVAPTGPPDLCRRCTSLRAQRRSHRDLLSPR